MRLKLRASLAAPLLAAASVAECTAWLPLYGMMVDGAIYYDHQSSLDPKP